MFINYLFIGTFILEKQEKGFYKSYLKNIK